MVAPTTVAALFFQITDGSHFSSWTLGDGKAASMVPNGPLMTHILRYLSHSTCACNKAESVNAPDASFS